MAITKLNSLAIPPNTIVESDLSYPLTNFSSTGIDDNATSTAITIDSSENVGIGSVSPTALLEVGNDGVTSYATPSLSLLRNHGGQSYINRQGMQFVLYHERPWPEQHWPSRSQGFAPRFAQPGGLFPPFLPGGCP